VSEAGKPAVGEMGWLDLTVAQADVVRDFYGRVVGWTSEPVDMGDYSDFSMMTPAGGGPVAGICHARGENAAYPAQWIPYFVVESLDRSIEACVALGGRVLGEIRSAGGGRYCLIEDPAGVAAAIWEKS